MEDFTKIKLINELIDVVERFYTLKERGELKDASHLKGFCEGMAYALISLEYLTEEEATKILKGMGKKREVALHDEEMIQEKSATPIELKQSIFEPKQSKDNLDIPTFLRKQK
jgi:uncharacterized protein with von Willebrand factor type A (vWA) domain